MIRTLNEKYVFIAKDVNSTYHIADRDVMDPLCEIDLGKKIIVVGAITEKDELCVGCNEIYSDKNKPVKQVQGKLF